MSSPSEYSITTLLKRARGGERGAEQELAQAVEPYLRGLAARQLAVRPDSVLDSGALLNEAWLKLSHAGIDQYGDRTHFLRAASCAMRSILVDRVRKRNALKRGGGAARLDLTEADLAVEQPFDDLLALDEAIGRLGPEDAELAEQRLFGGMSCSEIASLRGCAVRTVERRWLRLLAEFRERLGRKGD